MTREEGSVLRSNENRRFSTVQSLDLRKEKENKINSSQSQLILNVETVFLKTFSNKI